MLRDSGLYLISPPDPGPGFGADAEAAIESGHVAFFQLRMKKSSDDEVLERAQELREMCAAQNVALIVNDRSDLAARALAHGVHMGQKDGTVAEARAVLGEDAIIGVTCHDSLDLAISAAEQGANYVAFGAFFESSTKRPKTRATVDLLQRWSDLAALPCVAIGGISAANGAPLVRAGANFLAVSGAVWTHRKGPAAATAELAASIETAFN